MPLLLLVRLGARNLLRHRRRNLLMLCAIAGALAGVTLMNALIRGFQYDMADAAITNLTGHLKILAPGYLDDPSIKRSFSDSPAWQPVLADIPLLGFAPRIRVPAVILSERETRGVQLVGVDPAREAISFFGDLVVDGDSLRDAADPRIVIGAELARQLKTARGRRLVIMTPGLDGRNRESGFRIAGIYDAEGTGLEKTYAFTGLGALQALLDAPVFTEVSVRLQDQAAIAPVQAHLSAAAPALEVRSWQQLEPQAAAMFAFADGAVFIWFLVMMGALAFGLMNALITAVMERVRELGMLRAIGMRPRAVVVQVVIESLLLMFAGVVVGLALGVALIAGLADGIDLSAWGEGMELAGMRSRLVPRLYGSDLLLLGAMSMALGLAASLYPAWRAVRLQPLEALRR
jgi:ABC-type lipoprotein release transport system permease subunit